MIMERKPIFAKSPASCWGAKLSKQVILQHSKTLPGLPNPTSTECSRKNFPNSRYDKEKNPNLLEVSKGRVLDMVISAFICLQKAYCGSMAV